ncbi:hypothetical protein ScPMuIL_017298, partial [Solemya velum]
KLQSQNRMLWLSLLLCVVPMVVGDGGSMCLCNQWPELHVVVFNPAMNNMENRKLHHACAEMVHPDLQRASAWISVKLYNGEVGHVRLTTAMFTKPCGKEFREEIPIIFNKDPAMESTDGMAASAILDQLTKQQRRSLAKRLLFADVFKAAGELAKGMTQMVGGMAQQVIETAGTAANEVLATGQKVVGAMVSPDNGGVPVVGNLVNAAKEMASGMASAAGNAASGLSGAVSNAAIDAASTGNKTVSALLG